MEPLKGPAYDSLRKFIRDREHEALADEISSRRMVGSTRSSASSSYVFFKTKMFSTLSDDDKGEVEWVLRDSAECDELGS